MHSSSSHSRAAAGIAAVAACVCLLLGACTLTGSNVTLRSPTGVLPMTGEGRFADFQAAAAASRDTVLPLCFSRRFAFEDILGNGGGAYPPSPEEWLVHLERLDAALATPEYAQTIAAYFATVGAAYRMLAQKAPIYTSRAKNVGKRHRNDHDEPWGPNRQTVELRCLVRGEAKGTGGERLSGSVVIMEELAGTVHLIQEYEEWRIDGISGDLGTALLGEKATPAPPPAAPPPAAPSASPSPTPQPAPDNGTKA